MKPINLREVEFMQEVEVFGQKALFTILRIEKDSVPEGLYKYAIRHSDEDWMDPATLEKNVLVNHMGEIITDKEIDLGENLYKVFETDEDFEYTGYAVTITETGNVLVDVNNDYIVDEHKLIGKLAAALRKGKLAAALRKRRIGNDDE